VNKGEEGEQGRNSPCNRRNMCLAQQTRAREGMESTSTVLEVHGIPPKAKEYKG